MPSSTDRDRIHRRLTTPREWPAILLVLAIVVVPMVSLTTHTITGDSILGVWRRPGVMDSLRFTIVETVLSTILTVVLGLAPAWAFSQWHFVGRRFMLSTVTLPFVLPTVVVAAAILGLLPDGANRGPWVVVLAHVYFNLAVVIRTVGPMWSTIDPMLIAAARSLGASRRRAFLTVTLPLLRPSLWSATGIVAFMCASSYGIVRLLGGNNTTIEVEIYRRALSFGDVPGAATLAVAQFMVVAAALLIWTRRGNIVSQELSRRLTPRRTPWLAPVIAVITSVLIAVPMIALIVASVRNRGSWTMSGWRVVFGTRSVPGLNLAIEPIILRSLTFAILATLIAVPLGVLATRSNSSKSSYDTATSRLLLLPLGASAVAVGLGIVITYDRGLFDLRGSWFMLPVVHAVVALPFVVRTVQPVAQGIPRHLRAAAMTLGASPWRAWRTIEWPLLYPAIRTASALSMAISLGEFGATSLLTRHDTDTLPIAVDRLLSRSGDLARMSGHATAVVLLVATAGAFMALGGSRNEVVR